MKQSMKSLLPVLLVVVAACNEVNTGGKDPVPSGLRVLEGSYEGVYFQASPLSLPMPSAVTMDFTDTHFSGTNATSWPVICEGTYTLNGTVVQFHNTCMPDAGSDPVYYLDGTFNITLEGDYVVFTHTYPDNSTRDVLRLKPRK